MWQDQEFGRRQRAIRQENTRKEQFVKRTREGSDRLVPNRTQNLTQKVRVCCGRQQWSICSLSVWTLV